MNMQLGEARAPDRLRLYAIGDIHGCDHLLLRMYDEIAADLADRPTPDHRLIHLGDYVDRGPETAAVIERVSRLSQADETVVCLRGNHEEMLLDFLANRDTDAAVNFLGNGGAETLASYGISQWRLFRDNDLAERFAGRLPSDHRTFFENLRYSVRFGDFFFCHAGVRPGIALDDQDTFDLTWIRKPFLTSDADFGAVIVHGHTPNRQPEVRRNRINVDTGAVLGGPLTCVVLDGKQYRFFQVR